MSTELELVVRKEVEGYLGKPRMMSRDEFIKVWVNHVTELKRLCQRPIDYATVKEIIKDVEYLAGEQWDILK